MPLGMLVGLGPGHIVLDADRAFPPKRDTAPNFCLTTIKVSLLGGKARSASNTMWPGPRPTSIPSGIQIFRRLSKFFVQGL